MKLFILFILTSFYSAFAFAQKSVLLQTKFQGDLSCYVFQNATYDKYTDSGGIAGPTSISAFWPGVFSDNIQAAILWHDQQTVFFF